MQNGDFPLLQDDFEGSNEMVKDIWCDGLEMHLDHFMEEG